MTTYTKTQLKDAYCESKNFDVNGAETKQEFLARMKQRHDSIAAANIANVDEQIARMQEARATLPADGLGYMKAEALAHLAKQEAEQAVTDNAGVSL